MDSPYNKQPVCITGSIHSVPWCGKTQYHTCTCDWPKNRTFTRTLSLVVLCMAWLQAKSQAKPSHTGQAKPSQMSWPEAGFGLALEFRSQSQASKPWLWMNIYFTIPARKCVKIIIFNENFSCCPKFQTKFAWYLNVKSVYQGWVWRV